ncbi:MAG: type II toxin-antitoxin system VapC family toxin [Deltaproteobacteria bacterium]|nr:type II toxin-antitoxin system VapC family toxin [Deltaproteobacteria bacterium]
MIVADTHVIIWYALKPEMLSKIAKIAMDEANRSDGIICCDISLWEIAMLMHKGRLQIDVEYLEFIALVLESSRYIVKSITPEIAELSVSTFADGNKDPADRIISATSVVEKARLVTADKFMRQSKHVTTIW